MIQIKIILSIILLSIFTISGNDFKNTIYSGYESVNGFSNSSGQTKSNFLFQSKWKENVTFSIEKRRERDLGGFEYKNKRLYFSTGHRYKPIPGFYFLRDPYFYSAFQNPEHGVVQQPLILSGFLGSIWNSWGSGLFIGKGIAEKNPGIYIHSPKEIMGIAYAPESKTGFISLNYRNIYVAGNKLLLTGSSQIYGTKLNYFGYVINRIYIPSEKFEIYSAFTKDDRVNSLNLSQDKFGAIPDRYGLVVKFSYNYYNRLEHFSEIYRYGRESMTGGNGALFSIPMGSMCFGGRYYDKKEFNDPDYARIYGILAATASWEWKKNSEEFIIRYEERKNRDRLIEWKTTLRPLHDWRLEISTLISKKENQLRSVYEQWSDGENINTILTDRETVIKLKIIGSYIVINISGSRTKKGEDIFYSNLQFKYEF